MDNTKEIVWISNAGQKLAMREIDDRYLRNICQGIVKGLWAVGFVDEQIITKLFNEAARRKIRLNYMLEEALVVFRRENPRFEAQKAPRIGHPGSYDWDDLWDEWCLAGCTKEAKEEVKYKC